MNHTLNYPIATPDMQPCCIAIATIRQTISNLRDWGYREQGIQEVLTTAQLSDKACHCGPGSASLPAQSATQPDYDMPSRSGTDSSSYESSMNSSSRYSMRSSMSSRNDSFNGPVSSALVGLHKATHPYSETIEHTQHHHEAPIPESPFTSQSITSPKSPERATEPASIKRSSSPGPWRCPCCRKGNKRSADLWTHMKEYCGSGQGYRCKTCRVFVHTRHQFTEHRSMSLQCSQTGLGHRNHHLNYERCAFSCPTCGHVSFSCLEHFQHVTEGGSPCCYKLPPIGKGQRSEQIRQLLFDSNIYTELMAFCARSRTDINSFRARSWDSCSTKYLTKVVEQLEYGVRKTEADTPNLGIPKDAVDSFFEDLFNNGIGVFAEPLFDTLHLQAPLLTKPGTTMSPIQGAVYSNGVDQHAGIPENFAVNPFNFGQGQYRPYGA